MKVCSDCTISKAESEFYKNKSQKDGLHPYCKPCSKERTKQWRLANPDKAKEQQVGRGEYFAKRRETHREYYSKKAAQWAQDNPERRVVNQNKRRASERAGGTYALEEWVALCQAYGYKCLSCGEQFERLSPDHVVPLSKGGTNTIDNIQPLCLTCNIKKGAKTIDYRKGD